MLKDTILKFFKIDGFVENLGNYLETRVELFKIELKEEVSKSASRLSILLLLALLFLICISFLSVALAFWIATATSNIIGFATVGGLYLMLSVTLLIFKDRISYSVEKIIMKIVKKK